MKILSSKVVIYLLYLIVRGYLLTLSIKIENEEKWLGQIKKGRPILFCLFHQQFFFAFRFFRRYRHYEPYVMISQSRDGEIGALATEYSGGKVARGSSSRGGKKAMEELVDHLIMKKGIGIIYVDGPQGPIGIVKPGAIRIAQKAGAIITPTFFISDNFWQLNSWDEFILPKLFSNVTLKFGETININPIISDPDFEAMRQKLEASMTLNLVRKKERQEQ